VGYRVEGHYSRLLGPWPRPLDWVQGRTPGLEMGDRNNLVKAREMSTSWGLQRGIQSQEQDRSYHQTGPEAGLIKLESFYACLQNSRTRRSGSNFSL
jgi:hypothetical protein